MKRAKPIVGKVLGAQSFKAEASNDTTGKPLFNAILNVLIKGL